MTLSRVPLALVLVIVAVLLAAGCNGKTSLLPQGKYILVEHTLSEQWSAIGGECPAAFSMFDGPTYSFDRRAGNLRVLMCEEDQVNESLVLFFASGESSSGLVAGTRNSAGPVYSLPLHSGNDLSITQINSSGFVFIDYQNKSIVLEPGKNLIFNSSRDEKTMKVNKDQSCTVEIVRTDTFSHDGILDKNKIIVQKASCARPGITP